MSYSGAPSTPSRSWLYISDPYTDGLLSNATLRKELFCYTKAQGYTGFVMYEMAQFISGGVLGPTTDWENFFDEANSYGIEIAAAFGGPNTVQAIINWNLVHAGTGREFVAVVSEIEWWNYSHNLPFQDPDTGAYSFFDTVKFLDQLKPGLQSASLKLVSYLGFTKDNNILSTGVPDLYESAIQIVSINLVTNSIIVRGDFTVGNVTNGKQFTVGQKVTIRNYPAVGTSSTYTISAVNQSSGNTALTVTTPLPTSVISSGSGVSNSDKTKIRTYYNIISATAITPTQMAIVIPGDKRFRFENEYDPDLVGNVYTRGGQVAISGTPGADGIWRIDPMGAPITYDSFTNQTIIELLSTGLPTSATFSNAGFVDPDVFNERGPIASTSIALPVTSGIDYGRYSGDSELGILFTLLDKYWLHDYIEGSGAANGTPFYSYTRTRSRYIALWAAVNGWLGSNKDVSFIVSAENEYSKIFFEGKNPGGTVVYAPKNPIDAYKYIVTLIPGASPSQTGSPLYANAETDPNINSYLDIEGIVIFKDKEIRGYNTGNGPNIVWYQPYEYIAAVSPAPGGVGFGNAYCDDCIKPGGIYTFTQSFLSTPAGSAATLTFFNSTSIQCDGAAISQLNYDLPGTYLIQVEVTDGGTVSYRTVEIFVQSGTLTVTANQTTIANCPGVCTATANINISGGVAPYTWQIFPVSTGPSGFPGVSFTNTIPVSGLCADLYAINVTDANGLTASTTLQIIEPKFDWVVSSSKVDPLCPGASNGSISLFPTSGGAPYTYLWSTGGTANKILGVPAGTYSVVVTDSKGCSQTYSFILVDPPAISVSVATENVRCAGTNTGSASITATGGTISNDYTYSWSHNPFISTAKFDNLDDGTYTVTVTDDNGCTASITFTIFDLNPPLDFVISGPTTVCNLNQAGETYTITAPVGVAPYTYNWSGPNGWTATGPSVVYNWSNDLPGTYTLACEMTDDLGCTLSKQILVTVETWVYTPTITVTGAPLTSCLGSQVTLTVVNPQGSGVWNDPAVTTTPTLVIDNLWFYANSPGQPYTFTWTENDPNTVCLSSSSVTVQPPVLPFIDVTAIGPNPCGGPTNVGFVDVTVSGGCPPYTYAWTGPGGFTAATQDISGLIDGAYTLVVTDSGVPAQSETVTVNVTTSDPTITGVVTNSGCNGINTGAINVTVNGGTTPYSYLWNDGVTTQDRTGLPIGSYTLTVTDFYGCTDTDTFTIVDSNVGNISVTSQTNPTTVGGQDGSILLNITSTSPSSYPATVEVEDQDSYVWISQTVTFDSSIFVNGLPEGVYTITMTNALGCVKVLTVTLFDPGEVDGQDEITNVLKCVSCCLGKKIADVFKLYNNGHNAIECLTTPLYTVNSMLKSLKCWYPENYSFGGSQGYLVTTAYDSLDNTMQLSVSFLGQLLFTYNPNPGDSLATKLNAVAALFESKGFDTEIVGSNVWVYSPENSYYNGLTFEFVTTTFPIATVPIKGPVVATQSFSGAEDVCYSNNIPTSVCLTEEQAGDMFYQIKCFCNG
jgi:hypothetical protein